MTVGRVMPVHFVTSVNDKVQLQGQYRTQDHKEFVSKSMFHIRLYISIYRALGQLAILMTRMTITIPNTGTKFIG
jgi:hypothetical protein